MLDGMRKASQTWVGKAIMSLVFGVIILSFAVWGVADMLRGGGQGKVATLGDTTISSEAFRQAWQTEIQRLQQRFDGKFTTEQARRLGLDRQVLARLTNEAALDQAARKMGLFMSDEQLAAQVRADATFRGAGGQFDRDRFNSILRENNLTEDGFFRLQRQSYLRRELADALVGKLSAPAPMVEAIDRYRGESRSIEYFALPQVDPATIAEPAPEILSKFFDDRKAQFAAPEYRKFTLLAVSPANIVDPKTIPEPEVQALYDRVKEQRFGEPERRRVQQIVYPDAKAAQAALDRIKAGESFEQAVAALKLSEKEADLGLVSRQQIGDANVAAAAFGLAAGAVGGPVATPFGAALVRVGAIQPGQVKPLADVADTLRKELALDAGRKKIRELFDKTEDARSAGKPLAEAAAAAGLQARVVDGIDAQGRDRNGRPVVGVAGDAALLAAVFKSDVGVDNDVLSTRDGGYEWFEIGAVEPARARSLEESRAEVLAAWRNDEAQKQLLARAQELTRKLGEGAKLPELAAKEKAVVQHNNDVRRSGAGGLDEAAVVQIFNQPTRGFGQAASASGRIIFQVLDSAAPVFEPESAANRKIGEQLESQLADDILAEYIAKLESDYNLRINENAFRTAVGGSEP